MVIQRTTKRIILLIFPDLRMDGSDKTLAIKHEHWTVIEWDGTILQHCTTVPELCKNTNKHLFTTFTVGKESDLLILLNY